jgi:cleavage and polyadenylation specificity factor subunit 1
VSATGFVVYDGQLGILVADGNNNLQIFTYSPKSSESLGGKSLVAQSDFNVGDTIRDFFRVKIDEKGESQLSIFGKSDGSFGVVVPISEQNHRILSALQSRMYTQLQHNAGLHPRAFRLFKPETHSLHNPKKNIIDGELLNRFENLNPANQTDLSQQIGMKLKSISKKLMDVNVSINKF